MIFNNQSVEKGKDEEIAADRKTEEVIQSARLRRSQPAELRRENERGDSVRRRRLDQEVTDNRGAQQENSREKFHLWGAISKKTCKIRQKSRKVHLWGVWTFGGVPLTLIAKRKDTPRKVGYRRELSLKRNK